MVRVMGHELLSCYVFFFFFQAEDGIRDLTVTGVQTCALPISFGTRRRSRAPSCSCPAFPARGSRRTDTRRRTRCGRTARRRRGGRRRSQGARCATAARGCAGATGPGVSAAGGGAGGGGGGGRGG